MLLQIILFEGWGWWKR